MSVPEKIPLSELSRGDLEALTERLLAENAALKQAVAELRAEIAKLKGVTGRPAIRPSGMEQKTEPKPADKAGSAKQRKTERLVVPHNQNHARCDNQASLTPGNGVQRKLHPGIMMSGRQADVKPGPLGPRLWRLR